jgi:hypothetical protein
MNSISKGIHAFANQTYEQIDDGYELKLTSDNLHWALQQGDEAVKYTFIEGFQKYSLLEFAIKSQDFPAVVKAVELGAKPTHSTAREGGNLLHFYVESLEEDIPSDIYILLLLLESNSVNSLELGECRTALECALKHMAGFVEIHWQVIETLLERGCRIIRNLWTNQTPFEVLVDTFQKNFNFRNRTSTKEFAFLKNLTCYLELEKKYYPHTDSSLSLEKFKEITSTIRSQFSSEAHPASLSDSSKPSPHSEQQCEYCDSVSNFLYIYNSCFNKLVKDHCFTECFDPSELTFLSLVSKKNKLPLALPLALIDI